MLRCLMPWCPVVTYLREVSGKVNVCCPGCGAIGSRSGEKPPGAR